MVLAYSLGPRDHVDHVLIGPSGCFVRVLWVFALLEDRLLVPRLRLCEGVRIACVLRVFCDCECELES